MNEHTLLLLKEIFFTNQNNGSTRKITFSVNTLVTCENAKTSTNGKCLYY